MTKGKRVQKEIKNNIYVHNDIANAAFHAKERIEKNISAGCMEGVSLDILSCLIMFAFEFEAKMNFVGEMAIVGWKERSPFNDKVKRVNRQLSIGMDKESRPYSSIYQLKKYRDSLAHENPFIRKMLRITIH